jgi:DNA polymerase epsilon subunit 2
VIEKLQRVFEGFESTAAEGEVDLLFILMGNFVSTPARSPGGREAVTSAFSALADAIASCPRIAQQAKFLIVPGPQDPGINNALPRRPVPEEFAKELKKKVQHLTLASNPCRVRFFTQEIVLFREVQNDRHHNLLYSILKSYLLLSLLLLLLLLLRLLLLLLVLLLLLLLLLWMNLDLPTDQITFVFN